MHIFGNEVIRQATSVPTELTKLIGLRKRGRTERDVNSNLLQVITLFAREANPSDILQALAITSPILDKRFDLYPVVQIILTRGAFEGLSNELSTSRLLLRRAREQVEKSPLQETRTLHVTSDTDFDSGNTGGRFIWRSMGSGMLSIEK
jgi:hypothetical protein